MPRTRLLLTFAFGLFVGCGGTLFVVWLLSAATAFPVPDADERREALGAIEELPGPLRTLATSPDAFAPIPEPDEAAGDWLAYVSEPGQTFGAYRHIYTPAPTQDRRTIYLQPLGHLAEAQLLERLEVFLAAYFQLPVEVREPLVLPRGGARWREQPGGGDEQVLTGDLHALLDEHRPNDAFCVIGVTDVGLFPLPAWHFVFGEANASHPLAVVSFAGLGRDVDSTGGAADPRLRRMAKILAHEIGHVFGIEHCIYYHCVMNGSGHLGELDAAPVHLCPVDLRKLHSDLDFDLAQRYRDLLAFAEDAEWAEEVSWLEERIAQLAE